jgi:hypothetical protein
MRSDVVFGFLTLDGRNDDDPLTSYESAEQFSRSLPLDDPFKTLKALSDALSALPNRPAPDINQLGVLLALDHRTERLREELLINSVDRGLRWPPENAIWQSIFELSDAFGCAYEHFLRRIREKASNKAWLECAPRVLVHLFRHREVQSLLSLFRYEQLGPGRWRELHEAYLFAHLRNLSRTFVPAGRPESAPGFGSTLEQQYLRILLSQRLNDGQFMPREAFWARQWVTAWSGALSLESATARCEACVRNEGFVVDLRNPEGLKRLPAELSKAHLHFDPTPMLALINDEIKSLRDSGGDSTRAPQLARAQVALLAKLKSVYSLKKIRIERRGERKTSALMTAQVFAGMSEVIRTLYDEWQSTLPAGGQSPPEVEEITLRDVGGFWSVEGDSQTGELLLGDTSGPRLRAWRIKNHSASGTLLRGRVDDHNRMIAGSLVAFRDPDSAQWVVAVVRRLTRFVRNNVEIAVEHIGRNPQGVTLAPHIERNARPPSTGNAGARFAALFLRESGSYPKVPIKTLLLPAGEFQPGRLLTLLSTSTSYTLRLKEALESQPDFVWAAFEVIGKQPRAPGDTVDVNGSARD